jgi:hypothetical protein
VALAQATPINHSWASALRITPRGLSTATLPHGDRVFAIELDFIDHQLVVRTSDGDRQALALAPRSVADFYRALRTLLADLALPVRIWPMPVEIPSPIPFDADTVHHSYDPAWANRFWRILVQVERALTKARTDFVGKCSPVNFFWGSFDLAVTRFSVMREAYSHEVISHGFWPGSGPVLEPAFYAYAVPEPQGLNQTRVLPAGAFYHHELAEFLLPYEAVRTTADPEAAIRQFVDSTYEAAATLGGWDRAALERPRAAS